MSESATKRTIRAKLGARADVRLFNNPVGHGWAGDWKMNPDGSVTIRNPRRITYGLFPGSGDLIGWREITVVEAMVGHQVALFLSLEVKDGKGKPSAEQRNWAHVVRRCGGVGGIAWGLEEAAQLLEWLP